MIVAIVDRRGDTNLFILPITSVPPDTERLAIEIPQIERRRAGLDDMPLWIILDEYNHDILESSYYFDPAGSVNSAKPFTSWRWRNSRMPSEVLEPQRSPATTDRGNI
ncbi:MAG: hypothetical protein FWD68_05090 [Alphaproteobacteria bacterium]|nr:hypothetical protein [Alphaproteobacteria bacterium]